MSGRLKIEPKAAKLVDMSYWQSGTDISLHESLMQIRSTIRRI